MEDPAVIAQMAEATPPRWRPDRYDAIFTRYRRWYPPAVQHRRHIARDDGRRHAAAKPDERRSQAGARRRGKRCKADGAGQKGRKVAIDGASSTILGAA